MQAVTEADLAPNGWACEWCHQPFTLGDNAYGTPVSMLSDGTVVEGDWRCHRCWIYAD